MFRFWQSKCLSKKKEFGETPYLVVGLGNPGDRYLRTWHNLGFMAMQVLADEERVRVNSIKFKALSRLTTIEDEKVLLLLPQTYMNLSGESVQAAAKFYKIPPERIIVLYDDFDIPTGTIRIRAKGSAGTHNGMKSIIKCLGTEHFTRIRIGAGPIPDKFSVVDFVLSNIPKNEEALVLTSLKDASSAVRYILKFGVEKAMSKLNPAKQAKKPKKQQVQAIEEKILED